MNAIQRRRRAIMAIQAEDLHISDILCLDGIKNTRAGHNAAANKWEDLSGNNYDFLRYGASEVLLWGDDCMQFDATAHRLYNGSSILNGLNAITVEMVYKPTGTPSGQSSGHYYGVVFKNGAGGSNQNIGFYQYDSNSIRANLGSSGISSTTIGLNTIKHIAFVMSSTGTKIYLNGALSSSPTAAFSTSLVGQYSYLGYNYQLSTWYPCGNLYRLGVSSGEMTADEIAERYSYFRKRFNF